MATSDIDSRKMAFELSASDPSLRAAAQVETSDSIALQTLPVPNDTSSIDSDRRRLDIVPPGDAIVFDAPGEGFRLGYIDVACLVLNRMIGSGIFLSPQHVLLGTKSVGASLLFWAAGAVYALAGMHVYMEYGLNVPRVLYRGREQSVARSGGDLNYVRVYLLEFASRPASD